MIFINGAFDDSSDNDGISSTDDMERSNEKPQTIQNSLCSNIGKDLKQILTIFNLFSLKDAIFSS
jgi:hypothetical protein